MTVTDTASLCPDRARLRTAVTAIIIALAALAAVIAFASPAVARGRTRGRGRGCAHSHASVWRTSRPALQRAVVCLINRQRHARGLPALRENGRLNRSAQGWTNTMVSDRAFGHGADFASRITSVGFRWSSAGENIATGFPTPAQVVRAWMASTGHCQNILNPTFSFVGTGVDDKSATGSSAGTWTNDFALPMGWGAASGNWGPARGCPY